MEETNLKNLILYGKIILKRNYERHYIWGGGRNYISDFEGSQAVPGCPSGIDRVYNFFLTVGGLYEGEILMLTMRGLHVRHAVQRGTHV
jgi:hypothetical protein